MVVNTDDQYQKTHVLLLKYTESGARVWQRTVLPLGRGAVLALDAGRDGNVYLAGYTSLNGTDDALFARRYTASGEVPWAYAPRLAGTNEIARSVATRGPGNVYLAGSTDGKVNGVNKGDPDAFLIRLNSGGSKVWSL